MHKKEKLDNFFDRFIDNFSKKDIRKRIRMLFVLTIISLIVVSFLMAYFLFKPVSLENQENIRYIDLLLNDRASFFDE